mmetsp:Transcript_30526/g.49187  ORF Transcript_30526/g.49187 Transcript_30526/m.49187 type:complete len:224 (-) Transcript_30526:291-962(-)
MDATDTPNTVRLFANRCDTYSVVFCQAMALPSVHVHSRSQAVDRPVGPSPIPYVWGQQEQIPALALHLSSRPMVPRHNAATHSRGCAQSRTAAEHAQRACGTVHARATSTSSRTEKFRVREQRRDLQSTAHLSSCRVKMLGNVTGPCQDWKHTWRPITWFASLQTYVPTMQWTPGPHRRDKGHGITSSHNGKQCRGGLRPAGPTALGHAGVSCCLGLEQTGSE